MSFNFGLPNTQLVGLSSCGATSYCPSSSASGGFAIGLAISSISQANQNYNNAASGALSSGNYNNLPNGTFKVGDTTIIKGNGYYRVEPAHGHCTVVGNGGMGTYMK
jgi:hypothetical protein